MVTRADGLVVLVTGCTDGGIGAALCDAFLQRGATVVATARRVESMAGLASRGAHTLPLDVTSVESTAHAVSTAVKDHGRIDILINNAGQGLAGAWHAHARAAVRVLGQGEASTFLSFDSLCAWPAWRPWWMAPFNPHGIRMHRHNHHLCPASVRARPMCAASARLSSALATHGAAG